MTSRILLSFVIDLDFGNVWDRYGMNIGNRCNVDFWHVNWIHGVGSLASHVVDVDHVMLTRLHVAGMVNEHGFVLAWGKGFQNVKVESDCLEALNLIHRDPNKGFPLTLVCDIGRLCDLGWWVSFRYVPRNGNKVTDALAKLTSPASFNVIQFDAPSIVVVDLLHEDCLSY
ncbi:hypothetical protein V6N13_122416 [Hibiscus sabdariffa]